MAAGKAAASEKGAAARREAADEGPTLEFHGLTLQLPAKLPGSVVWRYGILRDNDVIGAARIIESMVGREQYNAIMDKLDEIGVTYDDEEGMTEIGQMAQNILEAYGMSQGEAEASQ